MGSEMCIRDSYYGMKDKLAVGTVTNMYDIVESMNNAGKIVKPC